MRWDETKWNEGRWSATELDKMKGEMMWDVMKWEATMSWNEKMWHNMTWDHIKWRENKNWLRYNKDQVWPAAHSRKDIHLRQSMKFDQSELDQLEQGDGNIRHSDLRWWWWWWWWWCDATIQHRIELKSHKYCHLKNKAGLLRFLKTNILNLK